MAPLNDDDMVEAQAFAVKCVVATSITIPILLILLHFIAAAMRIDFTPVKEGEVLIACLAVVALVAKFAFSKTSDNK
jgi:uncharacterized membrane protein